MTAHHFETHDSIELYVENGKGLVEIDATDNTETRVELSGPDAGETLVELDGVVQPAPAPRFSRTPPGTPSRAPLPGEDTDAVVADWL